MYIYYRAEGNDILAGYLIEVVGIYSLRRKPTIVADISSKLFDSWEGILIKCPVLTTYDL